MRIILADDDAMVLESLKSIMELHGITVVEECKDGSRILSSYRQHLPDLVLSDIRMKEMNGIEAAKALLDEYPEAKVLLLTTFEDEEYISEALRIGCKGYILKQNIAHLIPALNAANAGSMVFDEEIISKVRVQRTGESTFPELSAREKEIMEAVAEGLNNREIAARFYFSEGTVRNYISEILSKLNLRDRTQLAIYYYKNR